MGLQKYTLTGVLLPGVRLQESDLIPLLDDDKPIYDEQADCHFRIRWWCKEYENDDFEIIDRIAKAYAEVSQYGTLSLKVEIDTFSIDRETDYTDDDIRKPRKIVAFVPAPPPPVQLGRRTKTASPQKPSIIDVLRVYPAMYESDPLTWPEPLRSWWYHIRDSESAANVARLLRQYYGLDEELLAAAEWLERVSAIQNVAFTMQ